METLLKPDLGLMIWTIVTFLIMVAILKKIAWGPLLKALDERESKIKADVESAEKSRIEMERVKAEYEVQMQGIETRARALLQEAEQKGTQVREGILKDAEAQAKKLQERTRLELESEKERLVRELRSQVGEMSVEIAEKLMHKTVDKKVQDDTLRDFLSSLDKSSGNLH